MGQPHPYADVIKAWADGAKVQYQESGRWYDWKQEWSECAPTFLVDFRWRVKPERKKARLAQYTDGLSIATSDFQAQAMAETHPYFVKWLTDWIEYEEVNEDE